MQKRPIVPTPLHEKELNESVLILLKSPRRAENMLMKVGEKKGEKANDIFPLIFYEMTNTLWQITDLHA